MMIKYKKIIESKEKDKYKDRMFVFFKEIFQKELGEKEWHHFFLNSPYKRSILILALDDDKIIGSANLILQRLKLKGREYEYYLFTTSAVHKDFRPQGVYAQTVNIAKNILKEDGKDFIFGFSNETAYTLITKLFDFKSFGKKNVITAPAEDILKIRPLDLDNSVCLDDLFLDWRFEHKEYFYFNAASRCVICKIHQNSLDIIEVLDTGFENRLPKYVKQMKKKFKTINALQERLPSQAQAGAEAAAVFFPNWFSFDNSLSLSDLDISLLMSDAF